MSQRVFRQLDPRDRLGLLEVTVKELGTSGGEDHV